MTRHGTDIDSSKDAPAISTVVAVHTGASGIHNRESLGFSIVKLGACHCEIENRKIKRYKLLNQSFLYFKLGSGAAY